MGVKGCLELLSRSGMPEESSMVPFGPCLSPGMLGTEVDAAAKFREKLALRGLLAAITIAGTVTTTSTTTRI